MEIPCSLNGVVLDVICDACVGTGKSLWTEKETKCHACLGVGTIITEEGRTLLRFITRFVQASQGIQHPSNVHSLVSTDPPRPRRPEPEIKLNPDVSPTIGWHPID